MIGAVRVLPKVDVTRAINPASAVPQVSALAATFKGCDGPVSGRVAIHGARISGVSGGPLI